MVTLVTQFSLWVSLTHRMLALIHWQFIMKVDKKEEMGSPYLRKLTFCHPHPLSSQTPVPELTLSFISVTNLNANQLLVVCFTRKLCKFRYSKFQFRLYLDPVQLQRWKWRYSVNKHLFEFLWLPLFANISGTWEQILLKITLADRVQLNLGKPHTNLLIELISF